MKNITHNKLYTIPRTIHHTLCAILIALLCLILSQNAQAAEYHIDAINGNDQTGDGTQAKPYQTVTKVRPMFIGGDTVILYDGNYGKVIEGMGPKDVFSDWVTYRAADGSQPELTRIQLGADGGQYYGVNNEGTFDVYMRFIGIHILDGVAMYGPRHVEIENCLIERAGPWTGSVENIEKSAIGMRGGKDISIRGCEITRTGIGIVMKGHEVKLVNNHIHDISHDGIRATGLRNSLVEGNRIHGLDDGVDNDSGVNWNRHCDGIHIFIGGAPTARGLFPNQDVVFRGNIIYDIESQGVQFNNYLRFPEIHNKNITFENNIFGPSRAIAFNNADPVDMLIFRHNTFIYFPQGRTYVSPYRTIQCNNHTLRISGASTDVQVYNNILVSAGGVGDKAVIYDYNLIQKPTSGIAYPRFTIFDSEVQFENPEAFDGKLLSTSKVINAGTRVFAPTPIYEFDRNGTAHDNRPDMGAYETPGQNPIPEQLPPNYPGIKTVFVDDFEDANFKIDPWLEAPSQQGLSWMHPNQNTNKYFISRGKTSRNRLVGPTATTSDWLFSEQGANWVDYTFEFDAGNSYLRIGDGPVFLVQDVYNYYWLDISRDNGRLIRVMIDATGDPTTTILATNTNIEMPHSGNRKYKLNVEHTPEGIRFSVDADNNGSIELVYTDIDALAIAKFKAGKIGFHKDYPNSPYHKVSYDNIKVTVEKFTKL